MFVVAPTVSIAVTTKVVAPAAVGVPLRTPAALKDNPAGNGPGVVNVDAPVPPVAVIVRLYAVLTVGF